MRKFYWYLTAYIKKHGLKVLASVVAAVLIFSFFISSISNFIEKKDTQFIGLIGQYTITDLPIQVKRQVSSGLTLVEPDGSVSPLVAERWAVEDDGKTYRFLVKKGIYWQDGKELTPQDVQYRFQDVETITTPSDIVFKLPDAFAPFPTIVSDPLLRTEKVRSNLFFTKTRFIGIGENRITDYEIQGNAVSEITVENAQQRFIYRFYLTEDDAVLAFKRGEVDVLPDLTTDHDIMTWPTVTTTINQNTNRYLAIFFNLRNPVFSKNVRQALSYALDTPPGKVPAIGPINPQSWAYLESGKAYPKDLSRATERMLSELPPDRLTLELTTTANFETYAEEVKRQWEDFGQHVYQACQTANTVENKQDCEKVKIEVTIRVTNFPDTSNYQLLLIGQESSPDPDLYQVWHSEQTTNFTGYKNTRIDNLLEKGRKTIDQQERKEIYQEFQQFFLEDAPAVFLHYLESYEVKRK